MLSPQGGVWVRCFSDVCVSSVAAGVVTDSSVPSRHRLPVQISSPALDLSGLLSLSSDLLSQQLADGGQTWPNHLGRLWRRPLSFLCVLRGLRPCSEGIKRCHKFEMRPLRKQHMKMKFHRMAALPVLREATKCCSCFPKGGGALAITSFLQRCLEALINRALSRVCVRLIHQS